MRVENKQKSKQEQTPPLNRRLRDLRQIACRLKRSRMTPLQVCEAIIQRRLLDHEARAFFSGLPNDERHYWIASLYALLMPQARRRQLAAYFTPPHLANHAISALVEAGIQPGRHRILDPASGGAAFLVPLAARITARGRQQGARAKTILQSINDTLHGVEIDAGLAKLSQALLTDLLDAEIESSGVELGGLIERANTLELDRPDPLYDAVIGNPPYGRILRPTRSLLERYRPVISDAAVPLAVQLLSEPFAGPGRRLDGRDLRALGRSARCNHPRADLLVPVAEPAETHDRPDGLRQWRQPRSELDARQEGRRGEAHRTKGLGLPETPGRAGVWRRRAWRRGRRRVAPS